MATAGRAAIAGSLLESLDTEVDEDTEAAWATEMNRRVAQFDSGAVKAISSAEVRRRLAARQVSLGAVFGDDNLNALRSLTVAPGFCSLSFRVI